MLPYKSDNIYKLFDCHLRGFLRIENTETIRVVQVIIFNLIELGCAQGTDHESATRSHEVRSYAIVP